MTNGDFLAEIHNRAETAAFKNYYFGNPSFWRFPHLPWRLYISAANCIIIAIRWQDRWKSWAVQLPEILRKHERATCAKSAQVQTDE